MNNMGARLTGSQSHKQHIRDIRMELRSYGYRGKNRPELMPQTFTRWNARKFELEATCLSTGASSTYPGAAYFPYSAHTPVGGVTGELARVGKSGKFRKKAHLGKIVVVDRLTPSKIPMILFRYGFAFGAYQPRWKFFSSYQRPVFLHKEGEIPPLGHALDAGVKAVVLVMNFSPENADGQYLPFILPLQHVPAIYLDREQGDDLLGHMKKCDSVGTLELEGKRKTVKTKHVVAKLGGQHAGTDKERFVLVHTHTDGPNAFEENGVIGTLALAEYFNDKYKQEKPARSLIFLFATGHFAHDVGSTNHFLQQYDSDVIQKIETAVTVEHLGANESIDSKKRGYEHFDHPDPVLFFVSKDKALRQTVRAAVTKADLQRTFFIRPHVTGFGYAFYGEGRHADLAGIPTAGFMPNPTYLLSTSQNGWIDRFDKDRAHQELGMLADLIQQLIERPVS